MLRLALRGLVAHKVRLAATAAAVMLGVSFIAGTYVLTDTLRAAITGVLGQSQSDVAVIVQARPLVSSGRSGSGFGAPGLTLAEGAVARVARIPGTADVGGVDLGPVEVIGPRGKALSSATSLQLAISVATVRALSSFTLRQGRFPNGPGQAVLDAGSAARYGVTVGQRLSVAGNGAARSERIVGLVGYGKSDSLAGATIVGMTLASTQAVLGQTGRVYEVVASARPGVTPNELSRRISVALGTHFKVQTEQQAIASTTANINKGFSVFGDVLLVFAGVALFVAIFLIFNTFSILLAQRTKELALLRCIGAQRGQLLSSVLAESAIIGVVASILGLGLGVILALGLRSLLSSFGVDLPSTTPVIALRTVVVSVVVGTVATMAAAILPAIRGSRVSPVAALRDELAVDTGSPAPLRLVTGVVLVLLGTLIVVGSLHADGARGVNASERAEGAGLGLVLGFLGLAALVPLVARPLAGAIGWPFAKLRGVPGQLGRRNAMRNPRRTAATAAALMIGLTLVTTIAVFARSVQSSADASFEHGLHADLVLTPSGVSSLSSAVATRLGGVPQLRDVAPLSSDRVQIGLPGRSNHRATATGTPDVLAYSADVSIPAVAGQLANVRGSAVAVTTGIARSWHLGIGSTLPLASAQATTQKFTVAAIIHDQTGFTGDILLALRGYERLFPQGADDINIVLAKGAPGISAPEALVRAQRAMAAFPQVKIFTKQGFIDNENQQFGQLVGLLTALLGLAVIIALFGIVNTLALSVIERTKEIGLLRALGLSRRQLRAAVRWESVVVALLGTLLGIVLGLAFGWVVVDAVRSDGVNIFSVPVTELVVFIVLAGVAGVLAAVLPARSAARVDVLAAIATE